MSSAAILGFVMLGAASPATGSAGATSFKGEWRVAPPDEDMVRRRSEERLARDVASLERFRPGYSFWQYVFTIPDGSIAFGSAEDGRLLASFPVRGDWTLSGRWEDSALASVLDGSRLPRRVNDRRDQVALLLERSVGPVVNNPTRGDFLRPNAKRYGSFLAEWGTIYERFGVPAEVGLAQAIIESGLSGRIRSESRAIGFCQWLPSNWNQLRRLSGIHIEAQNQTTQAPYCAAYLTVLATKYGSFIPALSEHHAGASNVGRTVINGERLGGTDIREQYFMGADLSRDLRAISTRTFRRVVGTYGPRSFRYAEMVLGNTYNVKRLRETIPQDDIYAMRTTRAFSLDDIRQRTGLSTDQLKRFNPALVRRVPKGATLYLPIQSGQFGSDVAFWHRPPPPEYLAVLSEFLNLQATTADWEDPTFDTVLKSFRRRFRDTNSEEGAVMATVLDYVVRGMPSTRRILSRYRRNPSVRALLERGVDRLGLSADTRPESLERPLTTSALGSGMVESQTLAPSTVTALTHTVRSGENLSVIARRYGITLGSLMAVNPGLSPRRLMPGTELLMPTPALGYVQTHRVRAGDNFSVIARSYGVSLNGLIVANPHLDPRRLQIGQRLRIPADTN